jgi:hypothetical protein
VRVAACGVSGSEGPEGSDPFVPPQERRMRMRGRKLEIALVGQGPVSFVFKGLIG